MPESVGRVAIVDYGMGNLFSVKHACHAAGLTATITESPREVVDADAVILPGVGAFADAMGTLDRLGLADALRRVAESGRPLLGICLGMQLLMTESHEFGEHPGLGIIRGTVVRFDGPKLGTRTLKVPQVGWNRMFRSDADRDPWVHSPLAGLPDGVFMYFVHSYYVRVEDEGLETAYAAYGDVRFTAAIQSGTVFACQAHPERSGPDGLTFYRNFAAQIAARS